MTRHSDTDFQAQIRPIREEIDSIDGQILALLARRKQQVEKVVALKKEHHMPVFHPAREADLISGLRQQAEQCGVEPDFIEELYRLILKNSRAGQARQVGFQASRPGGSVLIVGGNGQMGQLFSRLFRRSGYQVRVLEQDNWQDAAILCKNIDLALVCVTMEETRGVIEKLAPFLSENTILADLTSIKETPLSSMLNAHEGPVAGFHPLFGPDCDSLERQLICVTPGRLPEQWAWLSEQMELWGAVLVEAEAREHDRIMEFVQALRHFATFCFGRFLHKKQISIEKSLQFSSPIYRLELIMVGRLFAQSPDLYAQIIFASPERLALLKEFISTMNSHLELLDSCDTDSFIRQFNEVSQWFGSFGEQAMRESAFLINKLTERQ